MGKRDSTRTYYTLYIPDETTSRSTYVDLVARDLGARVEGQVGELEHYYMISAPSDGLLKRTDEDKILLEFQNHKLSKRNHEGWAKVKRIDKQIPKRLVKRGPIQIHKSEIQTVLGIKDPLIDSQWHLINYKNEGNDINVTGVWKQGITGKGVKVALLDDGVDYDSQDLKDNFFAEGSYDFNDHESLPTPKLWDDTHGTRCAGQIAAVKNDVCGVGIAYDAKVSGVRILSGDLTDADQALALNYEYQKNDIFSCSWGPADNGETMDAPDGILADAFKNGIEKGRGGKGSIYVFATGNGAASFDNCNFDGYTNSIYTITVGAIDHLNEHPPYSESCSAQLVHTTTVGKNKCTDRHGGTSAAAPNAAGIFALVLSIRPELTWRDLQHLCVQTAVPIKTSDHDWAKLPSGRIYNHKFGYGKLDTWALVEAAKTFELVNIQTWFELSVDTKPTPIPDSSETETKKSLKSSLLVTADMVNAAGLLRLEHITATVNIEHERRGDIVIHLESPNRVVSELATQRKFDKSNAGIVDWKFMSVKHWDEDPIGNWTLTVFDVANPKATGRLLNWTLTLFGELDPSFKGKPVNSFMGEHSIKETSVSHIPVPTHSDIIDDTPSRPTKNKSPLRPQSTAATIQIKQYQSTIVYIISGSLIVFGIAIIVFFYRKHHPSNPEKGRQGPPQGYEFQVLQPVPEEE
ncbi:hypothetical protein K501DRAFT_183727 [Backusella circina FSU 941]|nr:hypothetical protein K501DRAFT_183727 [Backusella circina FSU 941]